MAAQLKANSDDVMKTAKDMLEKFEPSWKEMSKEQNDEIDLIMRKHISDALQLGNSLVGVHKMSDTALVEKMKKLLSEEDFKRISGYVDQETYTMEITNTEVTVHRGGQQFRDPFQLNTVEGLTEASIFQMVSLVIECVFLLLDLWLLDLAISQSLLVRIIAAITPEVQQPEFQRIEKEFLTAWKTGGAQNRAKAIYNLVKSAYSAGIFMKIVKLAVKDMPWVKRMKTIAAIVSKTASVFASDGRAVIGILALTVGDAYKIQKKCENLGKMSAMHAALSK